MTFEEWKVRLARMLELSFEMATGEGAEYIAATGNECWREMFDDGLTPEEAANEEVHASKHCH